jgi:hypothetical protein
MSVDRGSDETREAGRFISLLGLPKIRFHACCVVVTAGGGSVSIANRNVAFLHVFTSRPEFPIGTELTWKQYCNRIIKQEALERTNRLLSFDTTRTT